jgi:hypothetical protein
LCVVFNRYIPSMYYHSLSITVWGEVGNALKNNRQKKYKFYIQMYKQSIEWNYGNAWVMLLQIIDFDSC